MSAGSRRLPTGLVLFLCLLASQSGVLVLSPILPDIADEFGVSVATAGQLRSFSGIVAGLAAILMARFAARFGLRNTIMFGLALLAGGSLLSAAAPSFAVLALAQVFIGLSLALVLSAGVAAAGGVVDRGGTPPGPCMGARRTAVRVDPRSADHRGRGRR